MVDLSEKSHMDYDAPLRFGCYTIGGNTSVFGGDNQRCDKDNVGDHYVRHSGSLRRMTMMGGDEDEGNWIGTTGIGGGIR